MALLFFAISRPDTVPKKLHAESSTLRVASANILFDNPLPGAAAAALAELDADVLLALEWTGTNLDTEILARASLHPVVSRPARGTHGIAVFARNELRVSGSLFESPIDGPCAMPGLALTITKDFRRFNFLGVHAPPPIAVCDRKTAPTVRAFTSVISEGVLNTPISDLEVGQTTLVAGDLNTLPWASSLSAFRQSGLVDAYRSFRWKLGPTWSPISFIPSIARIDYIFVPDDVPVSGAWTVSIPGSDHRAVVVDLDL